MKKKGIWIPIELMNDAKLDWPNKVLLAEIYSLGKLKNGCIASNQFFGDLLGIDKSAASKRITKLEKLGYISCENIHKDNQCIGRIITKGSSQKNNTVVPGEQRGSSRKPKRVVPKDPDPSSDGKPINTSTNSGLKEQLQINNTGANKFLEIEQTVTRIPVFYLEEAKNEAIQCLIDNTNLGSDILLYCTPDKHQQLIDIIGERQYNLISPQLNKFEFATRQLELNNSLSTEGRNELEPS